MSRTSRYSSPAGSSAGWTLLTVARIRGAAGIVLSQQPACTLSPDGSAICTFEFSFKGP